MAPALASKGIGHVMPLRLWWEQRCPSLFLGVLLGDETNLDSGTFSFVVVMAPVVAIPSKCLQNAQHIVY